MSNLMSTVRARLDYLTEEPMLAPSQTIQTIFIRIMPEGNEAPLHEDYHYFLSNVKCEAYSPST